MNVLSLLCGALAPRPLRTVLQMKSYSMLIDEIVNFSSKSFQGNITGNTSCSNCTHPSLCPGNCNGCLTQVHWYTANSTGRQDYNCKNMILYYCCSFLFQYASEIYHLITESSALKQMGNYRILSLGCGASPDLVAFEKFVLEVASEKTIQYRGFDVNPLWKPVHNHVKTYQSTVIKSIAYQYDDVVRYFNEETFGKVNVLVLQYLISHFYNTGHIQYIHNFFDNLVERVVLRRNNEEPFIIIINDVNSCNRGRDFFKELIPKLRQKGLRGQYSQFRFDHPGLNDYQRQYGEAHKNNHIVFPASRKILSRFNPRLSDCRSAQLLIEVT